ncbi:phage tail tape measure protein [Paraburkholderia antibiotica]|uniref:Phage tail protein n=1 Tax=Paraburkholderia antibiotica TaxID=2728839 RepID=A0A7X9X625_9BURK|nr:hypothetical protein [Paraburkholderia antibiotica]NML31774.1 hypothetical protein [Paraburkholderia antibiotica]
MSRDLKLRVVFDMVDRVARPLKNVMAGSKGLSRAIAETRKELAGLQKQQKTVNAVRSLRTEMGQTASRLKEAQGKLAGLREKLIATNAPTKRLQNEFRRASDAVGALTQKQERQRNRLGELSSRMQEAGRGARTLADYENSLRTSVERTSAALGDQNKRMQTMQAAGERLGKRQALASNMAVAGYSARSTGQRILGGVGAYLDEAKKTQLEETKIRALGVGESTTRELVGYAKNHKSFGVSTNENLVLMRDAMTILNDKHHAEEIMPTLSKMKFSNEALFGAEHGGDNEQKFMNMLKAIELRGGTNSAAAFQREANAVQKVITATGGRVGGDEWMNFIKTGGVAAKLMKSDAFYYQMEPLIQEMGGDAAGGSLASAHQNLIEGRTSVRAARKLMSMGLLDSKRVEYDKTGHVKAFADGALLNAEQFKGSQFEWMEKTLLPQLRKHGITGDQETLSAIGSMFTNRRAANLFSTMYLQRGAIHKSEALNKQAFGVDQGFEAAKGTSQGKELDLHTRKANLERELGEKILPMYNQALGLTASLLDRVTGFTERHQTATKALVVGLTGLGLLIGAGGTITLGLASLIGPLALTRYGMEMIGLKGSIAGRALGLMGGGFKAFGSAVFAAGRALLMSPIGLMVLGIGAAIALTAYLIYRYWEPISTFFRSVWVRVKEAFGGGIEGVTRLIRDWSPLDAFYTVFRGVMSWFGVELPAKFSDFGINMMTGLVNGIMTGLGAVKQAVMTVADSTVSWFKDKLGIHSPSRVFGLLGGFIGQGAALGIEGERPRVAGAVAELAGTAVNAFGAGASMFGSDKPMFDRRGPIVAAPMAAAAGETTYNINFNFPAGAGMPDSSALDVIEGRFRQLLERHERDKARRAGSSFSDRG